jgi:hypothetical protein
MLVAISHLELISSVETGTASTATSVIEQSGAARVR